MADFLFALTITHSDDTQTTLVVDATSVANRTQAVTAARALVTGYRQKYVKGGTGEKSIAVADRAR